MKVDCEYLWLELSRNKNKLFLAFPLCYKKKKRKRTVKKYFWSEESVIIVKVVGVRGKEILYIAVRKKRYFVSTVKVFEKNILTIVSDRKFILLIIHTLKWFLQLNKQYWPVPQNKQLVSDYLGSKMDGWSPKSKLVTQAQLCILLFNINLPIPIKNQNAVLARFNSHYYIWCQHIRRGTTLWASGVFYFLQM